MSGTTSERSNTGVRGGGSGAGDGSMTIDIRPMIEDVSQVMTKHITNILSGVIGEYTVYKETHDTIMGLPCVRKLQERIYELEQHSSGEGQQQQQQQPTTQHTNSREDEISQLQSAIVDLNRYIHALESRVDMKNVSGGTSNTTTAASSGGHDEESVRLEVHENDNQSGDESEEEDELEEEKEEVECLHKNVIITSDALETVLEVGDDEDAVEEAAEEEAEEEEEAEDEKEEDAEEAEEEAAEEAVEEAVDEEPDEKAEGEAEAEEELEEEAEEETTTAEPEEEETEEVEEVIIKGKTYFTTNPQNGIIYACVDDDVGDEVGVFKNGVAVFNKGKK